MANYKESGVDVAAGNRLVEKIKPLAASTRRAGSMGGLGGFGGLFDLRACGYADPVLVAAADGVGTKLRLAIDAGRLDGIGQDLVAMCVNDIIVQGAEPLFFLDYYACGALREAEAAAVVAGIAAGCRTAGCALLGGETAEMPGMYADKDFDLAGFAVGAAERGALLPRRDDMAVGDIIIGVASTGLHSNGFSLVRRVLAETGVGLADTFGDGTFADEMLRPTRIYRELLDCEDIKGMAHITGGGLVENLPRMLPDHLAAEIDLDRIPPQRIFAWLTEAGVAAAEMLRVFNCGAGMAAVCGREAAEALLRSGVAGVFELGRLVGRGGDAVVFKGNLR